MRQITRWLGGLGGGLLGVVLAATPAAAQDASAAAVLVDQKHADDIAIATLAAEVRWWWFNLDGSTQITDQDDLGNQLRGNALKWGEEYELDTQNAAPEIAIEVAIGDKGWGVIGTYMEMGSDGSQFLTESFTYDGQTYAVGDFVSQALDLRYGTVQARWMLVENLLGLHLGPTLGVSYVRFDQIVERQVGVPAVSQQVHETGKSPLPVIGASARWSLLGAGLVKLDLSGGYVAYDGNRGTWFDATLGVEYIYKAVIGIGGGLRFLHLDIVKLELEEDISWASGRFTMYGVYLSLEVRL